MSHHARRDIANLFCVASGRAACLRGDAQVSGIHEAHPLQALAQPPSINPDRMPAPRRIFGKPRLNMGLLHDRNIFNRFRRAGRHHIRIAAMTICAPNDHRRARMHRSAVRRRVATHAANALPLRLFRRFSARNWPCLLRRNLVGMSNVTVTRICEEQARYNRGKYQQTTGDNSRSQHP